MSKLIVRDELYKALEAWDWQELYLPVHFKELVDEIPTIEAQPVNTDKCKALQCVITKPKTIMTLTGMQRKGLNIIGG